MVLRDLTRNKENTINFLFDYFSSVTTVGPFFQMDTICRDYIVMTGIGHTPSRKVAAVNPTIYRTVTSTATMWMTLVYPSTKKAGENLRIVIT